MRYAYNCFISYDWEWTSDMQYIGTSLYRPNKFDYMLITKLLSTSEQ